MSPFPWILRTEKLIYGAEIRTLVIGAGWAVKGTGNDWEEGQQNSPVTAD